MRMVGTLFESGPVAPIIERNEPVIRRVAQSYLCGCPRQRRAMCSNLVERLQNVLQAGAPGQEQVLSYRKRPEAWPWAFMVLCQSNFGPVRPDAGAPDQRRGCTR